MGDKFKVFGDAVRRRFTEMAQESLFAVDIDKEEIWAKYLASFPVGSNPIFRTRTEHDCSCCRHFIRDVGGVVAIQNGTMTTVWDLNGLPSPYQEVADAMSEYVKALVIRDVFLTPFAKHGTIVSHEQTDGGVLTWNHFSAEVPSQFVTPRHDEKRGEARTTHAVLLRGMMELKPEAVETVADLIRSNAIYRGQEFQRPATEFQQLQTRLLSADQKQRELLLWTMIDNPVARFRNTVIGTLVQDLSEGMDLEAAVRSYEAKVAPQNYKRPTSLITKGMIQSSMQAIQDLGLEHALERRHARFQDVSVNSVLFVDNAVQGRMKGGIENLLLQEVKPAKFDPKKAEEIGIDEFVRSVLPRVTGLQLYLDNGLGGNFVSLTAPVHADAPNLFKWDNNFAWSYEGNVADSIKERVKRAGGRVENVTMRVSLAWHNTDDLDLHVVEPNGNHIYFGNKGTYLDVDMNVAHLVRDAVENIRWVGAMRNGIYQVFVHNFRKRETIDVGFTVEIENDAGMETLRFDKPLGVDRKQEVARIERKDNDVTITPNRDMIVGSSSRELWGLKTPGLAKVNSLILSPNYWDENSVGNKHWFFILDGCKNPLPTRGIYNEFLSSKLEKHRKVFEVLGDKTKCPFDENQMSGVGFSSTKQDKVTVVAMGPKLNRIYTIAFGN